MARSTVVDRDLGYRQILRALGGVQDVVVEVGIRQQAGQEPAGSESDLTLAEVATILEFGNARIPERPFMRGTFDENRAKYDARLKAGVKRALESVDPKAASLDSVQKGIERTLSLVAVEVVGDIQERIATRGAFAPNAPSTIARKGSSMPLIDTGRLRQSIDWALVREPIKLVLP